MADVLEMIFIHQGYHVDICDFWTNIDSFLLNKKPDLLIIGFLEQDVNVAQRIDHIGEDIRVKDLPLIFLSAQYDGLLPVVNCNHCWVGPSDFHLLSGQVKSMLNVTV